MNLRSISLHKNNTISDALKILNLSKHQIILIKNNKNQFMGTVTDGDIRRALIKEKNFNSKLSEIMNKNPFVLRKKISSQQARLLMEENEILQIPVIDKNKKVTKIYFWNKKDSTERKNLFFLLAGGFGKRLLPLTKKKPKALIKVFNKPMMEHVIQRAKRFGFFNFILSIYYYGTQIKSYFKNGKSLGVKISYIKENKPLGTAGSLYLLKKLKDKYVLVTNCDVISDIDYGDVIEYHKKHNADVTMVIKRYEIQNSFGVIKTKDNNFVSYQEKKMQYENINTGIYVFNVKNFKLLKREEHKDMNEFFEDLAKLGKKVIVYPIYERWVDLGQKEYIKNIKRKRKNKYKF